MEKVMVQSKQRFGGYLQLQMIGIGIMALLLGTMHHPLSFIFAFFYLAYFTMRDTQESHIAAVGILLGSLLCGIFTTYLYALGLTLFYLMLHVLQLFHRNLYRAMPYVLAILSIPYSLYLLSFDIRVCVIAFFIFLLAYHNHQDLFWLGKSLTLTSVLSGILCFSVFCFLIQLSTDVTPLMGYAILLGFSFFCEPLVLLLLSALFYIAFPTAEIPLFLTTAMLYISLLKHNKWLICVGLMMICLWFSLSLPHITLLAFGAFFAFLYQDERMPFHKKKEAYPEKLSTAQDALQKQIQHFSGIFLALSDYYAQVSDVEAQMLADMANALKYSADTIHRIDTKQTQKERILKALEGYQYDVRDFMMETASDGSMALEVEIRNIKKKEIQQTLLPLLEVLTHERLQVSDAIHRFTRGTQRITFENLVPFTIDAYADSQKNMFETSGDSFSIFRYRNTLISMISDGMGSGEHAAASSRLITNLFQRMVVSGIPKTDAIKCINKLLQSDAYATLDVVCFDCSAGKAYIFKSAACPTFLIRDGELYEVSGSSLPVGILSSIEPDCFVADLKDGDEYLIISDGVFMDEIYAWLKQRDTSSAKASVESLMAVLNQRQRMDDSTVVFNRVHKR